MRVSFPPVVLVIILMRVLANLMWVYFLQVRVIIADLVKLYMCLHTLRVLADL